MIVTFLKMTIIEYNIPKRS